MEATRRARQPMIITIDGPAGAGKTSVSKLLARRLGYRYLDTGALYRGVAVAAVEAGVAAGDDAALAALCGRIHLDLQMEVEGMRLLLDGKDITDKIRTPEISMMASAVSARPVVRQFLLATQRNLGAGGGVVAEGRDMGTVVFPRAQVKFYLDADGDVRARRRHAELQSKSAHTPALEAVRADMVRRDHNDTTRSVAPLQAAPDAVVIDSTDLTLEAVVASMIACIERLD